MPAFALCAGLAVATGSATAQTALSDSDLSADEKAAILSILSNDPQGGEEQTITGDKHSYVGPADNNYAADSYRAADETNWGSDSKVFEAATEVPLSELTAVFDTYQTDNGQPQFDYTNFHPEKIYKFQYLGLSNIRPTYVTRGGTGTLTRRDLDGTTSQTITLGAGKNLAIGEVTPNDLWAVERVDANFTGIVPGIVPEKDPRISRFEFSNALGAMVEDLVEDPTSYLQNTAYWDVTVPLTFTEDYDTIVRYNKALPKDSVQLIQDGESKKSNAEVSFASGYVALDSTERTNIDGIVAQLRDNAAFVFGDDTPKDGTFFPMSASDPAANLFRFVTAPTTTGELKPRILEVGPLSNTPEAEENTVTRTITYVDADTGEEVAPKAIQTATRTRTKLTQRLTNKFMGYDTNGDGDPDTNDADTAWVITDPWAAQDSPAITGYGAADQATVAAVTVNKDTVNTDVVVKYTKVKSGTVTVKYVLEDGTALEPEATVVNNAAYGTAYTTDAKTFPATTETIEEADRTITRTTSYELVSTPANASGTVSEATSTVAYTYRKVVNETVTPKPQPAPAPTTPSAPGPDPAQPSSTSTPVTSPAAPGTTTPGNGGANGGANSNGILGTGLSPQQLLIGTAAIVGILGAISAAAPTVLAAIGLSPSALLPGGLLGGLLGGGGAAGTGAGNAGAGAGAGAGSGAANAGAGAANAGAGTGNAGAAGNAGVNANPGANPNADTNGQAGQAGQSGQKAQNGQAGNAQASAGQSGQAGNGQASAANAAQSAPKTLANTGPEGVMAGILAGLASMIAGLGLIISQRRRRS